MEKLCRRCKLQKELSEFNKNQKHEDGLDFYCKECTKKQSRKWYSKNKSKVVLSHKNSHKNKKLFIDSLKDEKGCEKCGYNKYKCSIDYHHIDPNKKEFNISHFYRTGGNLKEKLLQEIEKCILLCANCHREFHHREYYEGLTLEQFLKE